MSPLNFDPMAPALPISTPASFAAELARATGRYYTQGMPENTGALSAGVFSPRGVPARRRRSRARRSSTSSRTCSAVRPRPALLLRRQRRPHQPHDVAADGSRPSRVRRRSKDPPFADAVPSAYERGRSSRHLRPRPHGRDTLLVVMSDHGFTSWRRDVPPERLAARERLPGGRRTRACPAAGAAHERRLDADAGLRLRPERPLRQSRRPGERTASCLPPNAAADARARRRSKPRSIPGPASPPSPTSTCAKRPTRTAASSRSARTWSSAARKGTRGSDELGPGRDRAGGPGRQRQAWSGDHDMDMPDVPGHPGHEPAAQGRRPARHAARAGTRSVRGALTLSAVRRSRARCSTPSPSSSTRISWRA